MSKSVEDPKIRPIGDRIVVWRKEAEKSSKGGIILPDNAQQQSKEGTVIACGLGEWKDDADGGGLTRAPMDVKVGDRVVFSAYAGNEVEIGGEKLLVMRESDILAVLE